MTTKTASVCIYPGTDTLTGHKDTSHESAALLSQVEFENSRLRELNREQTSRIKELESDLKFVFISSIDTREAVAAALKAESFIFDKDFVVFMEKVKKAVESDDINLVLAYVRQGTTKADQSLHDWMPSTKALTDSTKLRLVAVSKTTLRATQIKEHIEMHGYKSLSSRDARKFLAGTEDREPTRRDTIRAFKKAEKILPGFVLEVHNGMCMLVCKDS